MVDEFLSVGFTFACSWVNDSYVNGICCFWYRIYFKSSVTSFTQVLLVKGSSNVTLIFILTDLFEDACKQTDT